MLRLGAVIGGGALVACEEPKSTAGTPDTMLAPKDAFHELSDAAPAHDARIDQGRDASADAASLPDSAPDAQASPDLHDLGPQHDAGADGKKDDFGPIAGGMPAPDIGRKQ